MYKSLLLSVILSISGLSAQSQPNNNRFTLGKTYELNDTITGYKLVLDTAHIFITAFDRLIISLGKQTRGRTIKYCISPRQTNS